jgi:predicted glycosyltransferase
MSPILEKIDELTPSSGVAASPSSTQKKIWIDLDNSPHVPFFVPVIQELKARGFQVFLTARDSYQVCELLDYYGVRARIIGRHHGRRKILKLLGTAWRAVALAYAVRKEKVNLSLAHGSRGCMLASTLLGIESISISDYEHAARVPVKKVWVIYPEVIPVNGRARNRIATLRYPGIKEDVYLPNFYPDPQLRQRLGIAEDELLVTVRPPASEAHYHNPEGDELLAATLSKFSAMDGARVLLLPRNKNQEEELRAAWSDEIASGKILIPVRVEDGLNIIWNSDLVVSGGGTMNREAAAMGVPVYSIFRGPIGAVDRYLSDEGRLVLLESVDDVRTKIRAVRRNREALSLNHQKSAALETIVNHITDIAEAKIPVVRKRRK